MLSVYAFQTLLFQVHRVPQTGHWQLWTELRDWTRHSPQWLWCGAFLTLTMPTSVAMKWQWFLPFPCQPVESLLQTVLSFRQDNWHSHSSMTGSTTSLSEPRAAMIQWKVRSAHLSASMYKVSFSMHTFVDIKLIRIVVPPNVRRCTALPVYDYYSNTLKRIEIEWDTIPVSCVPHTQTDTTFSIGCRRRHYWWHHSKC